MTVKVLDFYTDGKLKQSLLSKSLIRDSLFCVLVEVNGKMKELATTVTNKYNYSAYKSYTDFVPKKAHEFNILCDFLITAKDSIMSKWNLSEEDYENLLLELELCLVKKYSSCNPVKKHAMAGNVVIRKLINTLRWRFKTC